MTRYNIVYKVATGQISAYGPAPFTATPASDEALGAIPDGPPDVRLQRFDGTALRAATAQEVSDYDAAQADATASSAFDSATAKAIKAAVIVAEANRLGVSPGALTPAQIAAVRSKFLAVYKAL